MASRLALPARVLVDLPNWLGDLVMALPALDRVVAANRSGVTVVASRARTRRLVQVLFPDAVVKATPRREFAVRTALSLRRHHGRFDVGVTFRNAARAKMILAATCRRTAGSPVQGGRMMLSASPPVERSRHQVHDQDALLGVLGLGAVASGWKPRLPDGLVLEGRARLSAATAGADSVIALAPGVAGGEAKRWPPARFGALAGRLARSGWAPVVVVGPGEQELAREVVASCATALPILGLDADACDLTGLIAAAHALVGNDSGAGHVAAMVGTPTVVLFGPTDPARTAPMGRRVVVCRRDVDCAPCLRRSCPLHRRVCLDDLEVEQVLGALVRLLNQA